MHNGGVGARYSRISLICSADHKSTHLQIADFTLIKRKLQSSLPDALYLFPQGYTDSEWAFALFLSKLKDPLSDNFTSGELRSAMLETLKSINALHEEVGVTSPSPMNFVVR